jgi:hypothetical protein
LRFLSSLHTVVFSAFFILCLVVLFLLLHLIMLLIPSFFVYIHLHIVSVLLFVCSLPFTPYHYVLLFYFVPLLLPALSR